jgi:cytidylate kinase
MIITLSRETGAGARVIGSQLGRKLRLPVIDLQIRALVAERLGTSAEHVAALDECLEPTGHRILRLVGAVTAPETGVVSAPGLHLTADDVERATREVILDVASRESCVIIGRGARWILGDRPGALHVRLIAPLDVRTQRYVEREGGDRKNGASRVLATDRARAAHVQRYFAVDWNDPRSYHLVINTGCVTLETATHLIVEAARSLAP